MYADLESALWNDGYAIVKSVLPPSDAENLIGGYADDAPFRSTVVMARHHFGSGEYRYYRYPLPDSIQKLRRDWYALLAPLANDWNAATEVQERYPADLDAYLSSCHSAGQTRPTPLILRYGSGDYNCMHQDVYGKLGFPFQITVPLSVRHEAYEGGETVLLEQAPRMQAHPTVLRPQRGDALIFPNRYRPRRGASGEWVRHGVRHGVSTVTSGSRFALGMIFHDAQ